MRAAVVALIAGLLATAALLAGASHVAQSSVSDEDIVADQYIVVLHPGAELGADEGRDLLQISGIEVQHIYTSALNGFAARIPASQLSAISSDPAVASIIPDRKIYAFDDIRSTGVRRSEADRNAITQISSQTNPIDVDVAVLDTGIDRDHPDLNVVGGYSCAAGETSWEDANGHGTHVAGIIGALDNGLGVVGVAPGARLWSIRVLNAQGEGEVSDLICAVDWVTANADTIEVANLSLGTEDAVGSCNDGALHQAVCTSVAAGVTYIAAAGNSGADSSGFVPAAYEEVITVSALADFDGKPGGEGGFNFFYGSDDTLATFSNYGAPVDIAAPGVGIISTWLGGDYASQSGTSMAAPHVAGAAAIYLYQNPGASPSAVKSHLLSVAWEQGSEKGFTGDVDPYPEKLLNVGEVGGLPPLEPPPPPDADCSLAPDHGPVGTSVSITCQGFPAGSWVWLYWDSADSYARGLMLISAAGDGSTTLRVPDSTFGEHQIIAQDNGSGTAATLPFTVEPALNISAESGTVNSYKSGRVTGFGAGEVVTLTWRDLSGSTTTLDTATTSATGTAYVYLQVPETVSGEHVIEATGQTSGAVATDTFVVQPSVSVSPYITTVGKSVRVNALGFAPQSSAEVALDGVPVAEVTTSTTGSAEVSLTVPETAGGDHTITVSTASGETASGTLKVRAAMSITSTSGTVGDEVTVTMTGFGASETVDLVWTDSTSSTREIGTATTSATGAASLSIQIPPAAFGNHRLEARGQSSGSTVYVYFYVRASISLDPESGTAGTSVVATLDGYPANSTLNLEWYDTSTSRTVVGTVTSDEYGSASTAFTVPEGATYGEHKVRAIVASGYQNAYTTFLVEPEGGVPGDGSATCLADPDSGQPGTSVTVSCWGFESGQSIRLYLDSESSTYLGSLYAPGGSATQNVTLRDATGGEHVLLAVGANSGERSETPITIEPRLSSYSSSVKVGSYLSLTLQGFGDGETTDIVWQPVTGSAVVVATSTIDSTGRGRASFSVPEVAGGVHTITATGRATGIQASMTIEVVPGIRLSPSVGYVGAETTVALNGFTPDAIVAVSWDGAEVATATVSETGSASVQLTIPAVPGGYHTIAATTSEGAVASANYRILASMSMTPTRGTAGTTVSIAVTGYGESEPVNVEWYETSTSRFTIASGMTEADGTATITFDVPVTSRGSHRVSVVAVNSNNTRSSYFYVDPSFTLSQDSGPAGTTVTADMTGYRAGETVEIRWYTKSYSWTLIASGTVEADGTASVTFTVPEDATAGSYKVEGYGPASYTRSSATFTVT